MFLMALEDREILVMVISWIALAALIRVSGQLGRARFWALGAGTALVVALVATNVEEIVPAGVAIVINLVEHLAYLTHTLFLLLWVLGARLRSLQP